MCGKRQKVGPLQVDKPPKGIYNAIMFEIMSETHGFGGRIHETIRRE